MPLVVLRQRHPAHTPPHRPACLLQSSLVRAGVLRASDVTQSAAYLGKDLVVTRASNKVRLQRMRRDPHPRPHPHSTPQGGVSLRLPVDLSRLARMYSFALPSQQAGPAGEGAPPPLPLTFISCHLASDSHGKTKFTKRNEHADEMLRSLGVRCGPAVASPPWPHAPALPGDEAEP